MVESGKPVYRESAPTPPTEYERGIAAGKIEQRLDQHEDHLAAINGSIDATEKALTNLAGEFQGMRVDMRVRDELTTTSRRRRERLLGFAIAASAVLVSVVAVVANILTG